MGLEKADPEVRQRLRQGKVALTKLTTNKRMEARNMGVSDTTVGRWCDVSNSSDHMPWPLLPLHSAADELLAHLAHERGKVLVDLIPLGELNGDLRDELGRLIVLVGKMGEALMKAYNDLRTPGQISFGEAHDILPTVQKIQRVAATAEVELRAFVSGDYLR